MWSNVHRTLARRLAPLAATPLAIAIFGIAPAWMTLPSAALSQERLPAPRSLVVEVHDAAKSNLPGPRGRQSESMEVVLTESKQPVLDARTLDRMHWSLLRRDLHIDGAMSCATANCHGGPRVGVSQPWVKRGMEFQIWLEDDPHSQSWRTISSAESVAMMVRLGIMQDGKIVDAAGFDNCLACHNSVRRFDEPRRDHVASIRQPDVSHAFLREGVGCAACHGPDEQWKSSHFQNGWSPQVAHDEGFVEASDLFVRARMCASCHVGDKDRDMNHDIIAAGHPTLRYELATFHSWQPKHWRDSEATDATFYEAQLWLAGQVASTDASLALLQSRAKHDHSVSTWPEFAAYNCESCHHQLGLDNQRTPIDSGRKAVALYSQWDDSGLRWLIQFRIRSGESTEADHRLLESLDQVKQAMETRPRPDAGDVAIQAQQARAALADWLDGEPGVHERQAFRSNRLAQLVAFTAGRSDTYRSWESATQFYLAAVAARESWPGGWDGAAREPADRLQQGLRYPERIDISRYEKRRKSTTASRLEVMQLGIELGSWLGPVEPEIIVDQDLQITESMRASLRSLIERVNQQHRQSTPPDNDRDAEPADAPSQPPTQPALPELTEPGRDEPRRDEPDSLLEQLQQRREARERENQNGQP